MRAPPPARVAALTVPPWASAIARTMASPRPDPSRSSPSPRLNGWKTYASSVSVPRGAFAHAARTLEWSRLEPGVIDEKFYVSGIGVVKELAASGPAEVARLARFTAP